MFEPPGHAAPPPGFPSSTAPLQSSSMPLQVSACAGSLPTWHCHAPFWHTTAPAEHGDVSEPSPVHVAFAGGSHFKVPKPQLVPATFQQPLSCGPSVGLSSMEPLQSLSLPSQVSGLAFVPPWH